MRAFAVRCGTGTLRAGGLALVAGHGLLTAAALAGLGRPAQAMLAVVGLWGLALVVSRRGLALGLFLLGATLFLFGWQAYVYPAAVFGLVLDVAALALGWRNLGESESEAGPTGAFCGALAVLALGSALLLPWDRLGAALAFFGPTGFFASLLFSPADTPAYALGAALRLAVFAVFVRELARCPWPGRFASLASGLLAGLGVSIVFGLMEHFRGDHYLLHYRFTSVFANPGWYAEYLAVAAPYGLIALSGRGLLSRGFGALCLALCAGGLVLTLARAGWIAGSLTFGAAVWLYFKGGPLVRFKRPYGHLPTLAVAGGLVVALAFWASGRELAAISRPINALLKERVGNFTDSPRPSLFRSGLLIAAEGPVFGLGYESYARHYPVLLATPTSWLGRFGDKAAEVFETSHNMYIQLVSGLGLAGLTLWLAMAGRAGWLLWGRVRDTASSLDAALLLSLAAFHVYAFFQEMFYVPAVLFLLAAPLARAMALEGTVRRGAWAGRAAVLAWLVAGAGLGAYAADLGLARTGARLGLAQWRAGEVVYEGFYPPEPLAGEVLRWSVGSAAVLAAPGDVELTLFSPTVQDVLLVSDAGPLDRLRLGGEPVRRRYRLPDAGDGRARTIFIMPETAFVPMAQSGARDPRRLGVAVSVVAGKAALGESGEAGQTAGTASGKGAEAASGTVSGTATGTARGTLSGLPAGGAAGTVAGPAGGLGRQP
jgi:O-antigen ligase